MDLLSNGDNGGSDGVGIDINKNCLYHISCDNMIDKIGWVQ